MNSPILVTKLFIPAIRPELVARPRLIKQLDGGLHRKLTLISAPAGFGKTTLVTEWLQAKGDEASSPFAVAWLSVDETDNDLARFLTYFIAALNHIKETDTTLGDETLTLLQSPQLPPTESVLIPLINEIAAISERIILVLDDYHLIDAQPIQDSLNFLLENQPPQLHLVIVTREDPLLPLSRLRARGQITELRAADLRFTTSEAAKFLNQVMGLNLSAGDIAALETRTEGWIAGLQLAAISLRGQNDTSKLIQSFTGSNRLVLDYLIDEVLNQQPQNIQNFLLQTAILDRMTGPLCDAVTGQDNCQEILGVLERSNLFIISLDNERRWYRYHRLFADLLRQKLLQNHIEQISQLHQIASEWYQQKSLWSDAIRHAFAAKDLERAADLIVLAWRPMNMSYRSITWLDWAKALPDELIRSRPVLSTACGWASLDTGDLEAAESHFRDAERWLGTSAIMNKQTEGSLDETRAGESLNSSEEQSRSKGVLDEEEIRSLSISIANGRAYLAQAVSDVQGTVKYAQRASELLRENEYFERGLSKILTGFAYWANGDLGVAYEAVADAISNMQMTGKVLFVISFTSYLADIMTAQGHLREAVKTYLQLLEIATKQGEPEVRETAVLHLGLSELYLEQGDMEAARRHLQRSEELGEQPAFAPWYRHWIFAHVRVLEAQGNLEDVIEMLNEAGHLYYRHPIPDVRPLTALLARAWLAKGNLTEALGWVRERGLSADDDLSYLREFEHLTLARVLIAQYRNDLVDDHIHDAMGLLTRLLKAAEESKRMGSVIEILVLRALAFEMQNKISAAIKSLERALILAEPERYFRIFVGEGPPMARLLYEALTHEIAPAYIQRLLGAFPGDEPKKVDSSKRHEPTSELIEPLSERELDVLRLIAEGLTNQEIASRFYLSLNTIKAHTRSIYSKLGVNNRTQAGAKARSLGLLPPE